MRGTPDQVGLAEWLANQQDGPAGDPASSEYQVPGGKKVALQKWIQGRADGCHFSGNATYLANHDARASLNTSKFGL